jgi:hypothetical protein
MIYLDEGLRIGLIILELLRSNKYQEQLHDISIGVGTFTNCRENGLTFRVQNKKSGFFTFCVYEHRNSDEIIVNGRFGYVNSNGDLPYISDSPSVYLKSFKWENYSDCAAYLAKRIVEFYNGEGGEQNERKSLSYK